MTTLKDEAAMTTETDWRDRYADYYTTDEARREGWRDYQANLAALTTAFNMDSGGPDPAQHDDGAAGDGYRAGAEGPAR
jgi:hypothetical protein